MYNPRATLEEAVQQTIDLINRGESLSVCRARLELGMVEAMAYTDDPSILKRLEQIYDDLVDVVTRDELRLVVDELRRPVI